MFHVPDHLRLRNGPMGSDSTYGNNGAFFVRMRATTPTLRVIASDGAGMPEGELLWEHVSVSLPDRTPTWAEMCFIKSVFWHEEDTVVQFHPPKCDWVNNHNYCLHMWRPVGVRMPRPPNILVGVQHLGNLI